MESKPKRAKLDTSFAVTPAQWNQFDEEGYVILEPTQVLSEDSLAAMKTRIDEIMLGKTDIGTDYSKLMMQLDSATGNYEDIGEQTLGHKGATLDYRKIQNLEHDSVFNGYIKHPVFEQACRRSYGEGSIAAFRVMFFNKPAGKGTDLPWHQDRWQHIDKDPLLTVYTAIDPAGPENGCVQLIPKSHKKGVINPAHHSAFLTDAQAAEHCPADQVVDMVLQPGQVALLHNHTLHRSGRNSSQTMARRAFSVNYMWGDSKVTDPSAADAHKQEKNTGYAEGSDAFPIVFEAVNNTDEGAAPSGGGAAAPSSAPPASAHNFSAVELEVFQEKFRVFDKDGDGKITKEELGSVMKALNMLESEAQLDKMFAEVDVDASGEIDFNEFLQMMASAMPDKDDDDARGSELKEAFDKFDANRDGLISRAELGDAMAAMEPGLTTMQVDKMMADADQNDDGFVSFDEFEKMIKSS